MTRAIALALLVLSGCAYGQTIDGIDFLPTVEGENVGASDLARAAEAWGLALPEGWAEVDASYSDVNERCSSDHPVDACTITGAQQVWISDELSHELRQVVLLHELGHVLSGRSDHVTEGCGKSHATSSHLMCAHAALTLPTAEDYDYLGEGQQ